MPVDFTQTHTPSPREVADRQTPAGGWTKATLASWGISWPPRNGWRNDLQIRWAAEHGAVDYHSDCPQGGNHDWENVTPPSARATKLFLCVSCSASSIVGRKGRR